MKLHESTRNKPDFLSQFEQKERVTNERPVTSPSGSQPFLFTKLAAFQGVWPCQQEKASGKVESKSLRLNPHTTHEILQDKTRPGKTRKKSEKETHPPIAYLPVVVWISCVAGKQGQGVGSVSLDEARFS